MELQDYHSYTKYGWMRTRLGLGGVELEVYAIIYSFTQFSKEQSYNLGQDFLAVWTDKTKRTIIDSIKRLVEKGLISQEHTLFGTDIYKTIYRGEIFSPRGEIDSISRGEKISPPNIISNNYNITNNSTTTKGACAHVCEEISKDETRNKIIEYLSGHIEGAVESAHMAGLEVRFGMTWEELMGIPNFKDTLELLVSLYFTEGKNPESVGRGGIRGEFRKLLISQSKNDNKRRDSGETSASERTLQELKRVLSD